MKKISLFALMICSIPTLVRAETLNDVLAFTYENNPTIMAERTNLKATGDTHATFNSILVGPALGVRARLTNTEGTSRSERVQAKEDRIVYASETKDCKKGYKYKVRIYTNDIEWSSNSKATIRFSADKK